MPKSIEYRDLKALGFIGYSVCSDGSVWSTFRKTRRQLLVRPATAHRPAMVTLMVGEKRIIQQVAKLVLLAFHSRPCNNQLEIPQFSDGDSCNCSIGNLSWLRIDAKHNSSLAKRGVDQLDGEIAQRIERQRRRLKLSMEVCGRRYGVSRQRWQILENHSSHWKFETILRICKILECDPVDLLPEAWQDSIKLADES